MEGPVEEGAPDRHEDHRSGHTDVTPTGVPVFRQSPPRRPSSVPLRPFFPDGRPRCVLRALYALCATWPPCGLGHRGPADQDPAEAIA